MFSLCGPMCACGVRINVIFFSFLAPAPPAEHAVTTQYVMIQQRIIFRYNSELFELSFTLHRRGHLQSNFQGFDVIRTAQNPPSDFFSHVHVLSSCGPTGIWGKTRYFFLVGPQFRIPTNLLRRIPRSRYKCAHILFFYFFPAIRAITPIFGCFGGRFRTPEIRFLLLTPLISSNTKQVHKESGAECFSLTTAKLCLNGYLVLFTSGCGSKPTIKDGN